METRLPCGHAVEMFSEGGHLGIENIYNCGFNARGILEIMK